MKKNLINLCIISFGLILIAGLFIVYSKSAQASVINVNVCVKASDNSSISGASVVYKLGSTNNFGTTDGTGCVNKDFPLGTTNLEVWASWNHTTSAHITQDISTSPNFNFQTILLTLRLETCPGTPLDGGNPRYGIGSTYTTWWFPGGLTGTSALGETAAEIFPGTYSFEMQYKATADAKISVAIPNANTKIIWQTTNVTLYYSGQISYGGSGDSTWFTKPSMELLQGTYWFHFRDGGYANLTISGCNIKKNVVVLTLKDSNGNPLSGGKARGGFGSSYWTWWVSGLTDANGVLLDIRDVVSQPTNMSYEMRYNNTTQAKTQNVSTNSIFQYKTILLTLRLETCANAPLDGGKPRYGIGSTYTTWWFPGGLTGTSALGETAAEIFPGTYSFEMQYKATADAKLSVAILNANTNLTWQTTNVTLGYNGQISYGGGTGDSTWFTKPSMELLPGTYKFNFRPNNRIDLTFSGCNFSKSYVALKVLDENGNGVPGAKATPAYGGSWGAVLPGVTDASGKLFSEIPPGYTKIKMEVNQGSVEQTIAQLTASNYTWTTQILRIWLNDHNGSAITDQLAVLDQGGGYWYNWGNLNASGYRDIQLFPRASAYKFKMTYNYTTLELFPVVSVTAGIDNFYFQTGQVISSIITQYSAGSWRTFTSGMELMPGTYTFRYPSQSGTILAGGILNIP